MEVVKTDGNDSGWDAGENVGKSISEEQKKRIEELAGMPFDQIPRVEDKDIEVINRKYFSHLRELIMTVYPNGIKFNQKSISKIPDVLFILPKISRKGKRIYIVASDEDEINSQKWANLKDDKRESRKITGRDLGAKIYKLMGWNVGYYYKVYGSVVYKEDEDDPVVLCFELADADRNFLTEKARASMGIEPDDLGDEKEAVLAEDERRREEQEQREKDKTEGKTPKKRKDTTEHLKSPDEGEFGPKEKDYKGRVRIPRVKDGIDGQMELEDIIPLTNTEEKEGDPHDSGAG